EVGLGGRLDATNLVTPLVSVITPLALEHTAVLGNTIQEIAVEKGGIIKEGVPVVTANQPPEALAVLQELAQQRNAPLTVAAERWQSVRTNISLDGQTFNTRSNDFSRSGPAETGITRSRSGPAETTEVVTTSHCATYQDLRLSLLGKHQVANATLVVAALHLLREQGVTWDEAALREGLAQVVWPARVEVLQRNPLVIADGAHTHASAAALIHTINDLMPKGWSRSTLILGISSNKDFAALLDAFQPIADTIILTRASHPRAAD
ncbi:MAG: bifunctional folylpolyglutamate synthase/dihydrofolate synthase, partial [Ardenticatenaceae bacterium]